MISINTLLRKFSDQLFISYNSDERKKIDNSINFLTEKLKNYFSNKINDVLIFGSYSRGTILPREFDDHSDIDLLVIFNSEEYNVQPVTYRNNLKKFADIYYPSSTSAKRAPSVVLELNHIMFDLNPCIIKESWVSSESIYQIPNSNTDWMKTEPAAFNEKLTKKNQEFNNNVKPVVRLLKYWNASHQYPFESYNLEQLIVENYYISKFFQDQEDTIETGFFNSINKLTENYSFDTLDKRLESLKNNAEKIKNYLNNDDMENAKKWLKHIIPFQD